MESLTISSRTKLFAKHNRLGDFSSSLSQIHFLRYSKSKVDFTHSVSLRFFKSSDSISSSSFSSTLQANVAKAEALSESTYKSKKVHVKFQLQRECLFGEQFFIVGDDPIIGLWDPTSAIPLDWSDEHIWTVELDLPIGKSIMFKLLLKGVSEEIFWQPGPDRIVETWETKNTIVVLEDWDNAELQKIAEEPSKDGIANLDTDLKVEENISNVEAEPRACDNENMESINLEDKEEAVLAENKLKKGKGKKPGAKPKELSLVAENIVESEKKLVDYVGDPVLVPGLTPSPNLSSEEVLAIKAEINNALDSSSGTDEAEDPGMPEPDEKQEKEEQEVKDIPIQEEIMIGNECSEEQHENEVEGNKVEVELEPPDCQADFDDVMQSDLLWGQKTLRKLLVTLGFSLDQT